MGYLASPDRPCRLLELPYEIRHMIWTYILPSTIDTSARYGEGLGKSWLTKPYARSGDRGRAGKAVFWRRGCTAILAVNRFLHDECARVLYGRNTFVLDVSYDAIRFKCRWLLPSGLTPNRDYAFLDHFSQQNLQRIRHYVVNVEHVDDYTGMIKYNCGGRGLTAGLKAQVQSLIEVLCTAASLQKLHVNMIEGNERLHRLLYPKANDALVLTRGPVVLDPLRELRNVKEARVFGTIPTEVAMSLQRAMTSPSPGWNAIQA